MQMQNQSEVARLLEQIDAEYEAGQRAINDPRIVAPHRVITYHMERYAMHIEQLRKVAGEETTAQLLRGKDRHK